MSDPTDPLFSVRGDARRTVAPDYVVLASTIAVSRASKGEAVGTAASASERLIADLTSFGGVSLEVETARRPLTWSAQSATTYVERGHNKQTGRVELTGQVTATVAVLITVRAFDMLAALGAVLANHETLNVNHVACTSTRTTRPGRTCAQPPSRLPSARAATTPLRSEARWTTSSTSRTSDFLAAVTASVTDLPAMQHR